MFSLGCLLSSCLSFSQRRQALVDQVSRGEYERALLTQEKLEKRNPTLLDLVDKGMILHLQGKFEASNQTFDLSERKIEHLYAKSISRETSTYLVNDLTQAYSGEIFEKIYVNIMMAFNYSMLGNLEDALVEIRRIDHKIAGIC